MSYQPPTEQHHPVHPHQLAPVVPAGYGVIPAMAPPPIAPVPPAPPRFGQRPVTLGGVLLALALTALLAGGLGAAVVVAVDEQGPQGVAGAQGVRGPIGPAGERGDRGAEGRAGEDGRDGANGVDGADGADGRDGGLCSNEIDGARSC